MWKSLLDIGKGELIVIQGTIIPQHLILIQAELVGNSAFPKHAVSSKHLVNQSRYRCLENLFSVCLETATCFQWWLSDDAAKKYGLDASLAISPDDLTETSSREIETAPARQKNTRIAEFESRVPTARRVPTDFRCVRVFSSTLLMERSRQDVVAHSQRRWRNDDVMTAVVCRCIMWNEVVVWCVVLYRRVSAIFVWRESPSTLIDR